MWREVADRVYVRRYLDYNVNVGLIVGEGDMLLVDTRASERQARELQAEIRWIGQGRLHVVNTHHHYDHAFGQLRLRAARHMGHESCALRLREDSQIAQIALAAAMPEIAQEYIETRVTAPNRLSGTWSSCRSAAGRSSCTTSAVATPTTMLWSWCRTSTRIFAATS